MKLRVPITSPTRSADGRRASGLSLVELLVTLGVGSIVLVIVGLLSAYGLQSFLLMGQATGLDDHNRLTADRMSRDLREATAVVRYSTDEDSTRLLVTNGVHGATTEYVWDAAARTLTRNKTDETDDILLRDCDSWSAQFFRAVPQASAIEPFLPATNATGGLDLAEARVLIVSWRCSRPVPASKVRTESAQRIQIVLRNSPPS